MFFHPAKLSEVGTYLLVRHHVGQPMCDTLKHWCNMLETAEEVKDLAEQECHQSNQTPTQVPVLVSDPDPYMDGDFDRGGPDERVWGEDEGNDDDDDGAEEEELEDLNQYLASRSEVGAGTSALLLGDAPRPPMFPPIFLCHLCIFLLIVASPRRSALAAPIPESDDHVT